MNAASKADLSNDLRDLVIGDLLGLNLNAEAVPHVPGAASQSQTFLASERTMEDVIEAIGIFVFRRAFSVDVTMMSDTMATIVVLLYDPAITIEGLI